MRLVVLICSLLLALCSPLSAGQFFGGQQGVVASQPGGAWTPASLGTNLRLALVADDISGSDGSAVSSWPAAYGTSWSVAQASGSKQPTLKTAFINGHNAVLFDRVDDWLATSADVTTLEDIGTLSIVFVARQGYSAVGIGPVVSKHNSGTDGSWFAGEGGGSGVFQFTTINSTPTRVNLSFAESTAWEVFVCTYDGSTMRVYINGVLNGTTAAQTGNIRNTSHVVTVGGTLNGGFLFGGHIAEIGCVSALLTDDERESYETYLGDKYGITITH